MTGQVIDRPRGQRWGDHLRYDVLIRTVGDTRGQLYYTWDDLVASLCDRCGDRRLRVTWERTKFGRRIANIEMEAPTPSGETAA